MGTEFESVYRAFGIRISRMREVLGIDQAELAKRVGLVRSSIANIEAGRQRILLHDVEVFAKAFGTSEKALMKGIWW